MGYEMILLVIGLCLLLIGLVREKGKFMHIFVSICAKFVVAGLLLYGVNIFLSDYGMYIPINEYTLFFSGVLGLPGVVALMFLQKNMLP